MDSLSNDMYSLRVSALTRAAALSPLVREVTIGPNSPQKKRDTFEDTQSLVPPPENPVEKKVIDVISREDRIYLENVRRYESEMAEASDTAFAEMIARMIQKRAEISEKLRLARVKKAERSEVDLRLKVQQMLSAWKYNDPEVIKQLSSESPDNQESHSSRAIENMNKIIEEQEVVGRLASIKESHAIISAIYEEINEMPSSVHENYVVSLNNIVSNMNNIIDACTNGNVTDKEVKRAEILAKNIEHLKDKAITDMKAKEEELNNEQDRIEHELREQNVIECENKGKELQSELKNNVEESKIPTNKALTKQTRPVFYTKSNYDHYLMLKTFLDTYEASYTNLVSDASQKKFCFDCRKAVNVPVNSLCSVSGHHIRDKYDKLFKLLRGEKVTVMDVTVSAAQHPEGLRYCAALLAKKLVSQGHLTVSSNPEAAFPLASVIIALWTHFPDLAKLIEANFQRECPYLVPMFLPQKEGQTKEDFLKSLGYLYDDNGMVEKQDKFLKRMSGIFRLCCAIWIAKPPRIMTNPNPYGLRYAWKWLASFVNLKPVSQISSTLLFDFFTMCGHDCMKRYGKQFMKVIKLMCMEYMPALDQIDEGGPKSRLEVLLQNILQSGVIPPPSGQLSPNVW